jgi:hypothetical protein
MRAGKRRGSRAMSQPGSDAAALLDRFIAWNAEKPRRAEDQDATVSSGLPNRHSGYK